MAKAAAKLRPAETSRLGAKASRELLDQLKGSRSRELVFAVVGYAGSGTTFVAQRLERSFNKHGYEAHPVRAREFLDRFASRTGTEVPPGTLPSLAKTSFYQTLGDDLRRCNGEYGVLAAYMVTAVKKLRAEHQESGKTKVFILDSLKHPDEVALLRHVYGANFFLIGVGCRPDIRHKRLHKKYNLDEGTAADVQALNDFVTRDAEDSEHKYGQQVNDTFHLSDYFVDNTQNTENEELFTLPEQLKRLDDLILRKDLYRPTPDERGMYYANAAALRSSCLSRQVGASILDSLGNVVATGANEVPRAGGGSYEEGFAQPDLSGVEIVSDGRCFKNKKYCSNTVEQNKIVEQIYRRLEADGRLAKGVDLQAVATSLKKSRVKSLIEFSRAVHAEMDALMSLVRTGAKLSPGATLYSTTYPCHNCARHIVAGGVSRVVYLEPYAKSLAIDLHDDSIADNLPDKETRGRVVFRPYQGVSPRLYSEVFAKRADLKDGTGNYCFDSEGQRKNAERVLWTKTYLEFEEEVEQYIATVEEEVKDGSD